MSVGSDQEQALDQSPCHRTIPIMDLDTIFKAYDVRGLYPSEIDEEAARRIGHGFATFADADRIAVGRDCRTSSPAIASALIEGIAATGTESSP